MNKDKQMISILLIISLILSVSILDDKVGNDIGFKTKLLKQKYN
ncbi:MAG: hypothetical protein RR486_08720 [Clostridium sp.]